MRTRLSVSARFWVLPIALLGTHPPMTARADVLSPTFTEAQEDVRRSMARNPNVARDVASFFGITPARLASIEPGRQEYLVAQYMVYLEVSRNSSTAETRQAARELLRKQDWGMGYVQSLTRQDPKNRFLCPEQLDVRSCYYFIFSREVWRLLGRQQ